MSGTFTYVLFFRAPLEPRAMKYWILFVILRWCARTVTFFGVGGQRRVFTTSIMLGPLHPRQATWRPKMQDLAIAENIRTKEYIRERIKPSPGDQAYLHLADLLLG